MAMETRPLDYHDGDTPLHGVLVFDGAEPRPGLLLVHGGAGLDEHARIQARRYAGLGLTVLACDMYGEGVAGDRERTMALLTGLRDDPAALVQRARAGLDTLAACDEARPPFAAVGFCFGGMTVLTLARFGVDVAGVVSMHGALTTKAPAQPGAVRAKVLACHGAADPHVTLAHVTGFAEEMEAAGAGWELDMYGGAKHGFTHEHDAVETRPGVVYHAETDRRSFQRAGVFLAEVLGLRSTASLHAA